jgi:hypothetical protein
MAKKLEYLDPARSVISALGGVEKVAEITGKHVSRVYRWMYPKANGGTDGFVPQPDAEKLLQYARDNDKPLTADSFFRRAA